MLDRHELKVPMKCCVLFDQLANDEQIMEMKGYRQHRTTDTYQHSLNVTKTALWLGTLFGIKAWKMATLVWAGMLHDFYLYDYHGKRRRDGKWHGFSHPQKALDNAMKRFPIDARAADGIRTHMFPGTLLHVPRYATSWIIGLSDKIATVCELLEKPGFRDLRLVPV